MRRPQADEHFFASVPRAAGAGILYNTHADQSRVRLPPHGGTCAVRRKKIFWLRCLIGGVRTYNRCARCETNRWCQAKAASDKVAALRAELKTTTVRARTAFIGATVVVRATGVNAIWLANIRIEVFRPMAGVWPSVWSCVDACVHSV